MICPRCEHKLTRVLETRARSKGSVTRRTRRCITCGYRWATIEQAEATIEATKDTLADVMQMLLGRNGDGHGPEPRQDA